MKRFSTYLGIVAALVVAVTAVPLAHAADPTPAELKALEIRGQALNQLCGDSTLTGVGYRSLCGNVGAANRPTSSELRAFEIRGQAMNHLCDSNQGMSAVARESVCGVRLAGAHAAQVARSSGFDWGDFGIGAGAMLGLVLVVGGIAAGFHYSRKSNAHLRPAS